MNEHQRRRQRHLHTLGRVSIAAVVLACGIAGLVGLYHLAGLTTAASQEQTMKQEPGILVKPCDVANGDLVVHENVLYEARRVEPLRDQHGGYQATNVDLWPPGSAAAPAVRTTWDPRAFPDLRIRVVGRAE